MLKWIDGQVLDLIQVWAMVVNVGFAEIFPQLCSGFCLSQRLLENLYSIAGGTIAIDDSLPPPFKTIKCFTVADVVLFCFYYHSCAFPNFCPGFPSPYPQTQAL